MKLGRPTKDPMTERIVFRAPKRLANRIRQLAAHYARGNVGKWLRHAALEAPRRKLK